MELIHRLSTFKYRFCYVKLVSDNKRQSRGGYSGGGGGDWAANHTSPTIWKKKIEKIVNILAEIKANTLERHLIVIYSFWHC